MENFEIDRGRHVVGRQEMLVASQGSARDGDDGRQFIFLQVAHDRAPTDAKQVGCLG
jgi:hypothetical protein